MNAPFYLRAIRAVLISALFGVPVGRGIQGHVPDGLAILAAAIVAILIYETDLFKFNKRPARELAQPGSATHSESNQDKSE